MVSEIFESYLKHKKYLLMDLLMVLVVFTMIAVLYEGNTEIVVMEIKQPFRVGKVINGTFMPKKEFCLGDIIAYELEYNKVSNDHGDVTDTVQDTFMYFYPPHPTMIPVGKGTTVKFLQTSKYWIVGNGYRIVKTVVFNDVGFLNRTKTHTFKSEQFAMIDCGREIR